MTTENYNRERSEKSFRLFFPYRKKGGGALRNFNIVYIEAQTYWKWSFKYLQFHLYLVNLCNKKKLVAIRKRNHSCYTDQRTMVRVTNHLSPPSLHSHPSEPGCWKLNQNKLVEWYLSWDVCLCAWGGGRFSLKVGVQKAQFAGVVSWSTFERGIY